MPAVEVGTLRCGVPLFENQLYGCVEIHAHVKVIVSSTVLTTKPFVIQVLNRKSSTSLTAIYYT